MGVWAKAGTGPAGPVATWLSRRDWGESLAIALLALVVLGAIFAPLVSPYAPGAQNLLSPSAAPSGAHLLGTDTLGRDVLSRLLWGARPALLGPLVLVVIATTIGSALGVLGAWKGGWWDVIVSRVIDILFAFPALMLALIFVALAGPGLVVAIAGLVPSYAAFIARVVRSVALRERHLPYVEALLVQGQSATRICVRHLVPNLVPVIITQAAASLSYALLDLAALAFLGVGLSAGTPDWGIMLSDAQSGVVNGHSWELIIVGLTFVLTVVALNVLSDRFVTRDSRVWG